MRHLFSFTRAKPWKHNRHASANCGVLLKAAQLTTEKEGLFAILLEVRYLSAVQIHLRRAPVRADVDFRQAAVALRKSRAPRYFPAPELFQRVLATHVAEAKTGHGASQEYAVTHFTALPVAIIRECHFSLATK